MRISGGDARGIRLVTPKGIRPTGERVRQAVASTLGSRISGARVLDLFCGSGAYGLEALSRGAASAVFVDTDVSACRTNVEAAGFGDVSEVRRSEVARYLARAQARPPDGGGFDLVFADPPYAHGAPDAGLLAALAGLLTADARVVWESRWDRGSIEGVVDLPEGYVLHDDRRYGDTRISTFTRGSTG